MPTATDEFRPNRSRSMRSMIVLILIVSLGLGGRMLGYRLNIQTASVSLLQVLQRLLIAVVLAYVNAYNHRDSDTMTTLCPTRPRPTWTQRHRAIGNMQEFKIITSNQDTSHGPHGSYWAVEVEFRSTDSTGAGIAYEPGPTGWIYYLKRRGPRDSWRIVDHGVG